MPLLKIKNCINKVSNNETPSIRSSPIKKVKNISLFKIFESILKSNILNK